MKKWLKKITVKSGRTQPINKESQSTDAVALMPPAKRYIVQTLEMKGYPVELDVCFGPFCVDIFLPEDRLFIRCLDWETGPLERAELQRLKKQVRRAGMRLVVVEPDSFYKGLRAIFFKLKQPHSR